MTGIPLNIDWQQILLHLLNFVILFGALYFLLYKPVKDFMNKRVQYYQDIDDKAKENLKETENVKNLYDAKIAGADAEIAAEREKARAEASKSANQKLAEATEAAEQIIADAKAEANREHDQIIAQAQSEISDLVTEATEKLVLSSTASDAFDQFLDKAEEAGR